MMGNKSDLIDKREISSKDAYKMAKLNILIGPEELSAKSDDIKNIFRNFIRICLSIDRKKHFLDVFKTELNLRIIILLKIHEELSLKELAYHLGKSKATISRHTRELIRLGLIKSHSKDDRPQPGTIKRKYYNLSSNFNNIITRKDLERGKVELIKDWEKLLELLAKKSYIYKKINLISRNLNDFLEATENALLTLVAMEELPVIEKVSLLVGIMEQSPIYFRFLTENQSEKVKSLSLEFHEKLNEILNDDDSEKSFLYVDFSLNMEDMVKYMHIDSFSEVLRNSAILKE